MGTKGLVDEDDVFAHRAMDNSGAFILGRNMFGPVRGPWLDNSWRGWWPNSVPQAGSRFAVALKSITTTTQSRRRSDYRGLAAAANHFARESHMNELAHAVGMDPLESV